MFTIFVSNICSYTMSPRLKKIRKVLNPPIIKGFKPYGPEVGSSNAEPILLHFEEYEALRLCDYEMYNHHTASAIMGISRPTFTRIYASVRQKVAMAFAEGRQMSIEGGKVYFDSDWYICGSCKCFFNNPQKEVEISNCPLCGSDKVSSNNMEDGIDEQNASKNCNDICFCPSCSYEVAHEHGKPCSQMLCPKCNSKMKRKSNRNKNC
jgi:uncharacterized protein